MDDPSDRDPMRRDSSRFEDAERAVRSVDESPSGSPGPGTPAANADESPLRTVGAAVALGVGGVLLLVLVINVIGLVGSTVGLPFEVLLIVSLAAGQYVGLVGPGAAYLRARGFGWRRLRSYLGVRLPTLREVGVVVGGYVTLIIGILIFASMITLLDLPEPANNQGAETFADNPNLIPIGIVLMFLVVGPAEEFLFRGVIQNRLRERLSVVPAVATVSCIFAGAHLVTLGPDATTTAAASFLALLVPAGIVLGAVYEYTGNFVVPWLLHSINNSVILVLILFDDTARESAGLLSALV